MTTLFSVSLVNSFASFEYVQLECALFRFPQLHSTNVPTVDFVKVAHSTTFSVSMNAVSSGADFVTDGHSGIQTVSFTASLAHC